MSAETIGFAGLSHLGIIYSMASAARGFSVVAFDDRGDLAAELAVRRFPVAEPGLEEASQEHGKRIRYTASAGDLAQCRLIFLTLDVATDGSNTSDLGPLEALIEKTASHAADGTVLVLMSQAPPGYCRALARTLPRNMELYYQVETLVFGNAVARAIHPERFMVGCGDPRNALPDFYRQYLEAFECPVLPMRFESAELCKIAINCFLVSSVTTSNTLAEVCENTGADWSEIVPALRLDQRIGPHAYLSPGLGIAGGNLERDLVTIQRLAAEHGCDAGTVTAWQRNSAYRKDWVLRRLFQLRLLEFEQDMVFGMWGLAYKQDTHSTKNSPALALLRSLPQYWWQAYDPAARVNESDFPRVTICGSALEAARKADALIVMTPWKEFAVADLAQIRSAMRGRVVLDPYGVLSEDRCREFAFAYHRLGAPDPC
jgi:UDPglucose 6-dehydrogenase